MQETDGQIIFKPRQGTQSLAVIFFQGGLANPQAYGPLCRKVAAAGYNCHLIKMSFRLPQLDYQKISTLFNLQEGQYVIGGHSQGGKIAAQFVWEIPTAMQGLFLMGTSHPRDIDLSSLDIPTLKFYAENDGLASVEEVLENKDKLPANTEMIMIEGSNHSQFGYLGTLFMDDRATITTAQQQTLVADSLIRFLHGGPEWFIESGIVSNS